MSMAIITCRPIGVIRSGHAHPEKTPIQPLYAKGCQGRAEIFPEYADGLRDLEGFSSVYLLYHFHRSEPMRLIVKPFLQDVKRGVFATRAPCRPNPIGLSIVELVGREDHVLHLNGLDVLDGTPLLDIKPFIPRFDRVDNPSGGWTEKIDEETACRRGQRSA